MFRLFQIGWMGVKSERRLQGSQALGQKVVRESDRAVPAECDRSNRQVCERIKQQECRADAPLKNLK
jgi:hypothetical protein